MNSELQIEKTPFGYIIPFLFDYF
ncbi:hypothetical protein KAOT1_14082 [Kordia algicida OT-1]|uniref:Uncharacterized protein n=1 Tax=Kordia algicida OT-1 TaxID=391587 RepID=A9DKL8_9FLAO|nr:hypothetical protein KAOT1_14082 [Kordia algicida OT-1]